MAPQGRCQIEAWSRNCWQIIWTVPANGVRHFYQTFLATCTVVDLYLIIFHFIVHSFILGRKLKTNNKALFVCVCAIVRLRGHVVLDSHLSIIIMDGWGGSSLLFHNLALDIEDSNISETPITKNNAHVIDCTKTKCTCD